VFLNSANTGVIMGLRQHETLPPNPCVIALKSSCDVECGRIWRVVVFDNCLMKDFVGYEGNAPSSPHLNHVKTTKQRRRCFSLLFPISTSCSHRPHLAPVSCKLKQSFKSRLFSRKMGICNVTSETNA
jgi:hypothetical protein